MTRSGPTYANVTATLALVLALGGTSYAVTALPRNSVGSPQIRDRSVRSVDLAPDAVSSRARGPRGPQGANGAGGGLGPKGADGAGGVAGPQGIAGPRGPSAVFADREFGPFILGGTEVKQRIVEVRVPAGSYQLQFSAHVYLGSSVVIVDCDLEVNGTPINRTTVVLGSQAGAVIEAPLAMTDVALGAAPMTIGVRCKQRSPMGAQVIEPRLVAISVESITEQ